MEAETKQPPASLREVYNIRSRVSVYNMLCAKSFPTLALDPRTLSSTGVPQPDWLNDSPEGTPFVHYALFYTPTLHAGPGLDPLPDLWPV